MRTGFGTRFTGRFPATGLMEECGLAAAVFLSGMVIWWWAEHGLEI